MATKYGVNTFIKEVHVQPIELDENFKSPEFQYVIENINIHSHNGNGDNELKIYSNGKLETFEIGNWKISPIIKQPFSWQGTRVEIEMSDLNSNLFIKKGKPDVESAFKRIDDCIDIKWVFETIRSMDSVESVKHIELLEYITETNRLINIYNNGVDTDNMTRFFDRVKYEIDELKCLKEVLTTENYQLTKIKVNNNIELFNTLNLKLIND